MSALLLTRLFMPNKSEVINKLILSAIVILGILLGHAITAAFHIPGI